MNEKLKYDSGSDTRCRSCPADEMRCCCGSLLARLVAGGIELKCRRCRRTIVLSLSAREQTDSCRSV